MNRAKLWSIALLIVAIAASVTPAQSKTDVPTLEVENLGIPLKKDGRPVEVVTREKSGRTRAWVRVESPGRRDVIGIDVKTGKATVLEFFKKGLTHTRIHKADNGDLYIYTGRPGTFYRYYVEEDRLQELGVPSDPAFYWLGEAVGPDGKFYVGAYPQASLVYVDPKDDSVHEAGKMTESKKNKYIVRPVASDDNVIYCPVGLHHKELWAYDAKTDKKQSILPDELMKERGAPKIWLAKDGKVYGQIGKTKFRCHADRIETVDKFPPKAASPRDLDIGDGERAVAVNANARLRIDKTDGGDKRYVDTEFNPVTTKIYCVATEYDGKIWGGGFEPADTFTYDIATGKTKDVGHTITSSIQIYDILGLEKGLFFSSYTGCVQDFYDPKKPLKKGKNPKRIGIFSHSHNQERGVQLCLGPDGMIYTGTIPVKGHIGGALIRINPDDFSAKVFQEPVKDLSCHGVISVPSQNALFVTASNRGGTSAIEKAKEGCVFLWDVKEEKVKWTRTPVPGTGTYARAALMPDGTIFGIALGQSYFVLDPATGDTIATGKLPVSHMRFPYLVDTVLDGKAYGVGDEGLFAYDAKTKKVAMVGTSPALRWSQGFCLGADGWLYFGTGDTLYRAQLPR